MSNSTPDVSSPSPEVGAEVEWAHAFIRSAVARVCEHFHTEPTTEPARAGWHWERNKALGDACDKAVVEYVKRFGRHMPEATRRLMMALEWAHHTNPYLDGTVKDKAFAT